MTRLSILAVSIIAVAGTAPALAVKPSQGFVLVAAPAMSKAELSALVGHSVRNADGEKIGNIEGIYVNRDGTVNQVIVGVGGFLGIGDHDVALGWNNLHFSNDRKDITVRISKTELKAMPKYSYPKASFKGTVFGDLD
jgi:hypothetical protein